MPAHHARRPGAFRARWSFRGRLLLAISIGCFVASAVTLAQGPVFRAAVDLIAVDVQVVDRDGVPIEKLGPDAFTVSINGRERNVLSAEFVRQAALSRIGLESKLARGTVVDLDVPTDPQGRLFILAIDNGSFEAGSIRPAMEAAEQFVNSLEPNDRLGLYVYPTGPRIPPTVDRAPVRSALASVTGEKWVLRSRYNLRPSEIVDITAALGMGVQTRQNTLGIDPNAALAGTAASVPIPSDWDAVLRVVRRECPGEVDCPSAILNEVASLAPHFENQADSSLGGLDELLRALAGVPGRKAVVLVSAGVLVSDRRDGRPDVGDLSRAMGQTAARANASVYTVQVEPTTSAAVAASRLPSAPSNRDRQMLGNWLDEFSRTAGGSRIYVPVGGGEFAFQRVLRETSAHYLLGVQPEEADRDGRAHQLKVRVARPGVTVHGRQYVIIPVRTGV
jgi:VWFA-related protein